MKGRAVMTARPLFLLPQVGDVPRLWVLTVYVRRRVPDVNRVSFNKIALGHQLKTIW